MSGQVFKMSMILPSDQCFLSWTQSITADFLSNPAMPISRIKGLPHRLTLATVEAVTNAIVHGNKNGESPVVELEMTLTEKWAEIKVKDTGPGYDIYEVPEPAIESCPTNGMGLSIIKEIMTRVSMSRRAGKNVLKMTKVF